MTLLIYLCIGAVTGILAGLFGVGGGTIIVPALLISLAAQGVSPDVLTHMALGTSLATICLTSISSVIAHNERDAILWPVFFKLTPGICCGVLLGSIIAARLSGLALQKGFGVFALVVSAQMFCNWQPGGSSRLPGNFGLFAGGGVIGLFSALFGIGGGSLTVPFLSFCRITMQHAVATAAAIGMPIAFVGALGYLWQGWNNPALPEWSSGYIYWPAFTGIAIASVAFARVGAHIAHSLSPKKLKQIFALFLALIGLWLLFDDMILSQIH
ncbi:MAG: sulfite exporter TauE/SafE family protein [Pseudomonadales bacterium]|nr:sulfite exporter TauE/SafE family protein [Pseudomonadales bacterium]